MRDKLAEIFGRLFDVAELGDALSPENVENWNSFSHIELVVELEKAFDVSIPASDAVKLDSVKGIIDYLTSRGIG